MKLDRLLMLLALGLLFAGPMGEGSSRQRPIGLRE